MPSHFESSENTDSFLVSFEVYPNPNQGIFTLKLLQSKDSEKSITVMDILGKEILQSQKKFEVETTIDISQYPKGIYYVKIIEGEKMMTRKIVFM